ncbi:hypothetical protein [Paraburkholderia domus]|uniref:Uncharacterized protein n=1 Tax=Paraburkholderia domus TaxID=2793075 RepID=A0A9N8N1A7_9BURK|nr:hypothetical protein [Paraburkholderia domus]MBK5168935.1 hypothetical protein [Burkholderia sp. R-70211]CAE6934673.1 hypothetical protein R70211_05318 [Paraburkholderia domus]
MTAHKKTKHHVRHVKHASTTNTNNHSLVKVVIQNDVGEWARPATGDKFFIDETPTFPSIVFEIKTDAPPPYQWKWIIAWDAQVSGLRESAKRGKKLKTFSETGSFASNDKAWTANLVNKIIGGKLSVEVTVGDTQFRRTIFILAKNPIKTDVIAFVASLPDTLGFDKVIDQESHYKNVINADNEPVVAGDAGYGLTQMTQPAPTYEQVWNWKENVKAGVRLYQDKQAKAKKLLAAHPYTDDQLLRETSGLWNGSKYYEWNPQTQAWERNGDVLCDPATSNIGWDMSNPINAGQTADQLHERDKKTYKKMKAGRDKDHVWTYSGVCYVDHLMGN